MPFALLGGSAHGLGHGELVEPVTDRGSYWWVVVPHADGLSTPAVYREFDRLHPDVAADAHVSRPRRAARGAAAPATPTAWRPRCATTSRRLR